MKNSAELLDLSGRMLCKRNWGEKLHRVRQKTGEMCCQEGGEINNISGRKLEDMIMNMKVQKKIKA